MILIWQPIRPYSLILCLEIPKPVFITHVIGGCLHTLNIETTTLVCASNDNMLLSNELETVQDKS